MSKSIILTLSKNLSLGSGNQSTMNWTCKEDKKWFTKVTKAIGVVVMGRKTFETMNMQPLKDRITYVITSNPSQFMESEILKPVTLLQFYDLGLKDYCVIGGEQLFKELWNKVEVLYISKHKNVEMEGEKFDMDLSNCILFNQTESPDLIKEIYTVLPFKSKLFQMEYADNELMETAKEVCFAETLDKGHPTGTIYVKENKIISQGANGSDIHERIGCERKRLGIPTGQGYELCEGYSPQNHSETKAANKARELNNYGKLANSTAYLYGHWWCCVPCSRVMEEAKVEKCIMSKKWTKEFFKIIV